MSLEDATRLDLNQKPIAANYEIQGETADWIKRAMIRVDKLLQELKDSYLILQVHDELIFEMDEKDLYKVEEIRQIMQNVTATKYLPYTVGIDTSRKSWYDKETYNE